MLQLWTDVIAGRSFESEAPTGRTAVRVSEYYGSIVKVQNWIYPAQERTPQKISILEQVLQDSTTIVLRKTYGPKSQIIWSKRTYSPEDVS
jgi:hypothetical protein